MSTITYTPPTALLDFSVWVECPHCEESNDIAHPDHDTEHEIAGAIFSNQWQKLNGWEVTCEHCNKEFVIKGVDY